MFRFALPLSGALVAACFVDAPPAGTAATGTSSSTASDTTHAGTLGASASSATSAGASTTLDGSSGATGGASSGGSGPGGSSTLADPTSSSSGADTTAGSGSSGSLVPPECPETSDEYTCTMCCAEAHSGAKTFFAALAPCLCVIGEGCLLACADLCEGGFPNELCYSTCVLAPPDAQCGDAAVAECAMTPACATFLDCYTTSDCANKP